MADGCMTEYHYTTYRMQTIVALDGDKIVLTPKQQRAIREQLNAAIERSMIYVVFPWQMEPECRAV